MRVPEHLGVIVGVQVDEAGGDDQAGGIDLFIGLPRGNAPDRGDQASRDADVAPVPGGAGAVHDHAVADHLVVTHLLPLVGGWRRLAADPGAMP